MEWEGQWQGRDFSEKWKIKVRGDVETTAPRSLRRPNIQVQRLTALQGTPDDDGTVQLCLTGEETDG